MDYDHIQLTDEELQAAITEGKKRKFFHEKHREYWQRQNEAVNEQRKTKRTAGFKMGTTA